MKLLWVKGDFLHPTTKGGQIRTLETLKRLNQWHEVHYAGLNYPPHPEALSRANEYCTHVYPIAHQVPDRLSPGFVGELVKGLYAQWPVSISRYRSPAMERTIEELTRREKFDCIVCDFLSASQNIPDLGSAVLFQHNVEAVIWKRQAERARNPVVRAYFHLQARKMRDYEREVCRRVKSIIAVSEADAAIMRDEYGAQRVHAVSTGVDLEYFAPQPAESAADLVFVGSMDWLPNIDGVTWFVREILPLIRKRRPATTVAVVGRKPGSEILELAAADPKIRITGTVPDVRPFLWASTVSIVPLRVGGGTRLKIYEAMAAKIPVISTTIGAEGLDYQAGDNIVIADRPQAFAEHCLALLENEAERLCQAAAAWELVHSRYSWEAVARQFERLLFPGL
jgi:sugar transferase (PEP-CTERM/EpsH1 system associated)